MVRLVKYFLVALGLMLVLACVGSLLLGFGIRTGHLVTFERNMQGFLDVARLVHVLAWFLLFWRWETLIDWIAHRQWIKFFQRAECLALKTKVFSVLAVYILFVVIGFNRLTSLLT